MSYKKQLKPYKGEVFDDAKNLGSLEAMEKWGIASIVTWHKLLEDWGRPDLKYKFAVNSQSPLNDIKVTGNPILSLLDSYTDLLKATLVNMDCIKKYLVWLETEKSARDEKMERLMANNGNRQTKNLLLIEGQTNILSGG